MPVDHRAGRSDLGTPDPEQLDRYLAGEASATEVASVQAWAAADPGAAAILDAMRGAGRILEPVSPPWNADLAWGTWAATRSGARALPRAVSPRRPASVPNVWPRGVGGTQISSFWKRRAGVAIAAATIIGVTLSIGQLIEGRSGGQPFREFMTPAGSRATVTLHDGTRLVLGPETRIRVPADFGGDGRGMELDGEALFTVVHDVVHPFVVRTAHAVIRDIGTTFSVRAYAADRDARIIVREGIVSIAGRSLVAHDAAVVDSAGHLTVRTGVSLEPYFAWVQGGLVFNDTPLCDVVTELARTLNLDITVADSALLAHHITSSFAAEPADEILDAVSIAVGASYTRTGRHVVMHRRVGAAGRHAPLPSSSAILTDRTVSATP